MAERRLRTAEEKRQKKRMENQRYYGQTAHIYPKRAWTEEEIEMVMEHSMTDREISNKIGRSMKSIQEKRRRIRRESEAGLADSDISD